MEDWQQRFEVESREVYLERMKVLAACKIEKGMVVADIGAGTGLYTRLFAEATGPDGWVYAVEISGTFLAHIVTASDRGGAAEHLGGPQPPERGGPAAELGGRGIHLRHLPPLRIPAPGRWDRSSRP